MARQVGYPVRTALILLLPALAGSAGAAVNRTLDYGLTLELNSEQEDRAFSDLRLNVSDDFVGSRFSGEYSLDSVLFLDHREGDSNDQHRGRFDSQLHLRRPTAWWNFNGLVEVLPVASDTDIEEFSSQTVSTLTTGPTLSLGRRMRGSLQLSLLASELRYSETPLDSARTDLVANWTYPLQRRTDVGIEARRRSTEYHDAVNAGNDFDQDSLSLLFATGARDLDFNASVTASRVDSQRRSNDVEGAEVAVNYRLNSASSVRLTASDSLQSSEEFNRLPGNLEEAQFEAGLLRNRRVGIGYRYDYRFFNWSADIFSNDVENIVDDASVRSRIEGVETRISDQFLENYRYSASYRHTENDTAGSERQEIDLAVSYIVRHTRATSSQFGVFVEFDETNGASSDNAGLRYLLNSRIF